MINTNLINKKVAVIKTDGFIKLGILKHIDRNFIVLKLLNGDEEIISFRAIDTI
jgi:small nuclear ribonucleoprotein (snRNP)-like protein